MEESVSRDTHPWKIIIAWVIVLIPRLWARYQQGSVQREKRQSGPDVWIFRWREAGLDGSGKVRKAIVGRSTSYYRGSSTQGRSSEPHKAKL